MNNTNNTLGILTGMLIGGLAGAVTMLLLAPQSGEKTRTQIQEKSLELRDHATELGEETLARVSKDGKKFAKNGNQKAKELMQQGQELVAEQLEHVSEAARAGQKAIQST
jgi:gas vesicle protein